MKTDALATEPTQDEGSFDFWLGSWTTRWTDATGRSHVGSNVVLKFDRRIRELFEGPSRPHRYVGASVSEWKSSSSAWHQEYWDNSGYHAFFEGGRRGDRFILDQLEGDVPSTLRRRLVWHAIKADELLWDYEASEDGGATWASTWHMAYSRR